MAIVEVSPERRKHDLTALQNDHSEYLYRRENEIQDKIEQEQSISDEEWHLIVIRKFQELIDAVRNRD